MSEKTNRLLKIYSRLRQGPLTMEGLKNWAEMNGLEISDRTLYRDLKELQQTTLIKNEKVLEFIGEKNRKTWKIEFTESKNNLTKFDIDSFYLFTNFAPLALLSARQESIHKLKETFYQTYSKSKFELFETNFNDQLSATNFYELPYSKNFNKTLDDCIWSIQNNRKMNLIAIEYDYTSISKSVTFPLVILPLQLVYHRGAIHLLGLADDNDKIIVLAIEQLKKYKLSNKQFKPVQKYEILKKNMKKRFGITENMNDKIYSIELEFSEFTGSFINNHFWHPSQECKQLANGNYILKLTCGINRELVGWIFHWMNNCKVLKPLFLKNIVRNKLEKMQQIYTEDKDLHYTNTFRPI